MNYSHKSYTASHKNDSVKDQERAHNPNEMGLKHEHFASPDLYHQAQLNANEPSFEATKKNKHDHFDHQIEENFNFDERSDRLRSHYDECRSLLMIDKLDYPPFMPINNPWSYGANFYVDEAPLIKREDNDEMGIWGRQVKSEDSHECYQPVCQNCEPKKEEPNMAFLEEFFQHFNCCQQYSRQAKNSYRRMKVEAYLQKKKQRSFRKKVIYRCRKEVADNRIRYKGMFISEAQAVKILGLNAESKYPPQHLKDLINRLSAEKETSKASQKMPMHDRDEVITP